MVSDKGHLEWKKMYFKLSRCYPHREQYSDTLHFCTHCHILFWKVLCFILFQFALDQCRCETKMFLFLKQRGKRHYKFMQCLFFFFFQDINHPCTANNPESCTMSLSPQDFINLFKFWSLPHTDDWTVHTAVHIVFFNITILGCILEETGECWGSGTVMQSGFFWPRTHQSGLTVES